MAETLRRVSIAPAVESERAAIDGILRRTGLFRESEVSVALEVLDAYLFREGQEDYQVLTASLDDRAAGYVCFGPNTMTEGTWELYWIAVDPPSQGLGIGGRLMAAAEAAASRSGGRLVAVETSSRADYGPTLRFYRRLGYVDEARVSDYYAPGDDKIILLKRL